MPNEVIVADQLADAVPGSQLVVPRQLPLAVQFHENVVGSKPLPVTVPKPRKLSESEQNPPAHANAPGALTVRLCRRKLKPPTVYNACGNASVKSFAVVATRPAVNVE